MFLARFPSRRPCIPGPSCVLRARLRTLRLDYMTVCPPRRAPHRSLRAAGAPRFTPRHSAPRVSRSMTTRISRYNRPSPMSSSFIFARFALVRRVPTPALRSRLVAASPWKGSLTPRVTTVDDSPERAPPSPVTVARRRRCSPRLTSLLSRHADARCATFHHLERPWCCRVRIVNRASSAADPEGPPPDVCTPCVAEMPDPLAHRPGRAASSSCLSTHPRASCLSRSRPAGRSRESPLADLMRRQAVAERSVWTHQDEHLVHRASSSFFPRWSRLR
jgi:hypothetical protein